ncbi:MULTISPECIES: acyltransferase family protein [Microbacterium]|uniref:acyltransferase family protein n=1 Tax=Microbacterium TaxID=33882 RepID=UPI00277D9652|nr:MULTISPECIES: acyltransferase family protein [Microbacterium]MDQ1077357.1 fucose 4-O-acetylase-like acetyltransferase [Microbacterium sp. SORGH_AS_0969]MDQ1117601.1 fucose 4-O-acetylase-like acetyltransferase [Microbacterium testaceum]
MTERIGWVDLLRGVVVVLLLLWHASSLPAYLGWEMPVWLFLVNEIFLPWRMPTLMFLSGMLLTRGRRKDLRDYYRGKARTLLWPYLVWSALYLLTFPFPDGSILSARSWIATGYLWFIFFLLAYVVVAPLATRLAWPIVILPAAVISAVEGDSMLGRVAFFAVFFFGGYFLAGVMPRILRARAAWILALSGVALVFTTASVTLSAVSDRHFFQFSIITAPAVFAMIFLTAIVASRVAPSLISTTVGRSVAWMGRNSIVFYLAHFPAMVAVGQIATMLPVPLGLWLVVANLVVGLLTSSVLARHSSTSPVAWLFRAPRRRPRVA